MNCPFSKEITEMKQELTDLRNSYLSREDWLRVAKKKAGYDDKVSFDIIFKELLEARNYWNYFVILAEESPDDENMQALRELIKSIKKEVK